MRPKPRTPESNDVFRQLAQVPQHLKPKVTDLLQKVERLLKQQPQDSHKLYSLHAQPAGLILTMGTPYTWFWSRRQS